jgi:hypothetical protein
MWGSLSAVRGAAVAAPFVEPDDSGRQGEGQLLLVAGGAGGGVGHVDAL